MAEPQLEHEPEPEASVPAPLRPVLLVERVIAGLEVLLCSGFPTQLVIIMVLTTFGLRPTGPDGRLSASFVFTLTLADTVLLIGLILLFVRAHGESARDLLLGSPPPRREALLGLLLIPVSFLLIVLVLGIAQAVAPELHNVARNPFQDLLRTRLDIDVFAFVGLIAGGVREEVQRAFVLRRFEQFLGGAALGLVLFSIVFGLGHVEQGLDVALATAVLGLFWGVIYLRRRSAMAPMVCHAGFNLLQVGKFLLVRAMMS